MWLKKKGLFFIFFLMIFIGASFSTIAQGLPDPDCDPLNPACPIDGGVSLLILAGVALGAKRAFSHTEG